VVSLLEALNVSVERFKNWRDTLKVVILKSPELLDSSEKLNKFRDSSAEQVKLTKDLVWGEFELLAFWHVHEPLLGNLVLVEVSLVELDAAFENWDEFLRWILLMVPQNIVTEWLTLLACLSSPNSSEVQDVVLTVGNHLIGDLNEQTSHSLVGVVVSGDSMDHLDTVHQCWKSFHNDLWSALGQWLDELLESLEVFHIVFGLVE